jgi:hypothetical protein
VVQAVAGSSPVAHPSPLHPSLTYDLKPVSLFKNDEQKTQEAAALAAVRATPVPELAADILERVFGPAERELSPNMAFGSYKTARGVDLEDEDQPLFAEALQHLQNHRAIALFGFRATSGGHAVFYILTSKGRDLLARGQHRAALAD